MMSVRALGVSPKRGTFNLYDALHDALDSNDATLESGDVIVISTKFVSVSQGRIIRLSKTAVSRDADSMASRFRLRPQLAEIILRESDYILGGMPGFVLAYAGGVMSPNAGIDASNAGHDTVIIYPTEPTRTAENLRRHIFLDTGITVGIILADSRLMPGRVGTTGIAVACAGIEPVQDMRGDKDLEGKPLRVTFQAIADGLASAGNHVMSEGGQARPFALIRGSGAVAAHRMISPEECNVSPSQCVYVRGLAKLSTE